MDIFVYEIPFRIRKFTNFVYEFRPKTFVHDISYRRGYVLSSPCFHRERIDGASIGKPPPGEKAPGRYGNRACLQINPSTIPPISEQKPMATLPPRFPAPDLRSPERGNRPPPLQWSGVLCSSRVNPGMPGGLGAEMPKRPKCPKCMTDPPCNGLGAYLGPGSVLNLDTWVPPHMVV